MRVDHEKKSDGLFTMRKSDGVRVEKDNWVRDDHEKKSDGLVLTMRAMG